VSAELRMYYTACTEPQVEKLFNFKRVTEQSENNNSVQESYSMHLSNYTNAFALAIMHRFTLVH